MTENNSIQHHPYMQRCFQLAKVGESFTPPNPMVGAVLVYEGRIIGEGYHTEYGAAHAEVDCIQSVKEADKSLIEKSTLYVSLEPCSHFGKTPPCTDLIIHHKIPKVVISVLDTFHKVNGSGIQKLRDNGVDVVFGILEEEGKYLIRHFLYYHKNHLPYVTLKVAQSKEGFMGIHGQEINISNALAKRFTHKLRAQHQGILIGKNTVLSDNPELNVRHWNGRNPERIILGDETGIPKEYHIFNGLPSTLFLSGDIHSVLKKLAERNIISILVEGGANTLEQFLKANLWNEAHIIHTNISLKQGITAPTIRGTLKKTITLDDNTIHWYKND